MPGPRRILISCGEASGDQYAADVAVALANHGVELFGVGGRQLEAAGVPLWADLDQLSVMGFGEVVRHLPRLRRLRNDLATRARRSQVDLLLAVDYPTFHLSLARQLQTHDIPTLHYIPPKTWSWGRWRNRSLRQSVRRCAVIFPFEEAFYRDAGIDARYVGHPLIDRHAEELRRPQPQRQGLLLVPGSRRQELERIGPVLGEAVARLQAAGTVARVTVSRAPSVQAAWLAPMLDRCRDSTVVEGPLLPHLRRARAALVTSGTATIEAALAGTPHAIVYRTSAVSYAVARALARVDHIGMANIILGRRAVPELLQENLTVEATVTQATSLLDGTGAGAMEQRQALAEVRGLLGEPGAAQRVADLALETLDSPHAAGATPS